MPGFGRYNTFPLRFGGGKKPIEEEHEALLDAYSPGWDVSEDTAKHAEAYAHALAISVIWACNKRLSNQALPLKMQETLSEWESVTRLRPAKTDLEVVRRRRLAAKLRGLAGNTVSDIHDACELLLGAHFDGLHAVDPADEIASWPGINPGPPGYEWSSNRCHIQVQVNKSGLTQTEFRLLMNRLELMLDALLPAWMTYAWHTGSGFIVGTSLLGEAAL